MDFTDRIFLPVNVKSRLIRKKKRKPVNHVEKSYGSLMISELLPLKSVMAYQLSKRGYNVQSLKFNELVPLYYNEFVSDSGKLKGYKKADSFEFKDNVAFKINPSDSVNGDLQEYRNRMQFGEVSKIINDIVDLFKDSQLKKKYAIQIGNDPKKVLTSDELIRANAAEKVTNDLENKIFLKSAVTKSQFINTILIFVSLYIIYTLLFKNA